MRRTYRYRLTPTKAQCTALHWTLDRCRELYNACLEERREAYKKTGRSPSCYNQTSSLPEIKALRSEYELIHSQVLQNVVHRLDKSYKAFFRRCKSGETPGYPRFKAKNRYSTFTYPQASRSGGVKLVSGNKRLRLSGIGNVKIKLHRPYEGVLKQVSITLDSDGHWYALFSCDGVPTKPLPKTGQEVGIDLGISTFAAKSDGGMIENPRPYERAQARLAAAQRKVSRRKKRSNRYKKAVGLLAKQHANVRNTRKDFHHKTARILVRQYDSIYVENLSIHGLSRGMLAKQVNDAAWGTFLSILSDKAEEAGREIVKVNPCGTSQICSACGVKVRKALSVRVHRCSDCGYNADRDVNAARNVLRRGQRLRGEATEPR